MLQALSRQAGVRLYPASRSSGYRQKMQRECAGERLWPSASVDDMMEDDYSEKHHSRVAAEFQESPIVIQTQVRNNRRISPEDAPSIVDGSAS